MHTKYMIAIVIVLSFAASCIAQGNIGVNARLIGTFVKNSKIQAETFDLETGFPKTVVLNIKPPALQSGETGVLQNLCVYDKGVGQTAEIYRVGKKVGTVTTYTNYLFYFDTRSNATVPTRAAVTMPP